ncbi:hypothetical protein [Sphingorhabdus sp.]|jgi:hypothetical protein|uniref:hypothetical protein n=1 Tax=Sphingorhabdus sp. TaxID=1902408 RepID=UPI004048DCA9
MAICQQYLVGIADPFEGLCPPARSESFGYTEVAVPSTMPRRNCTGCLTTPTYRRGNGLVDRLIERQVYVEEQIDKFAHMVL